MDYKLTDSELILINTENTICNYYNSSENIENY